MWRRKTFWYHFIERKTESEEKKKAFLWHFTYKLINTEFKIQEIFPSRLSNLINKLMGRTSLFIGFANLSGSISCSLTSECINLYKFLSQTEPIDYNQLMFTNIEIIKTEIKNKKGLNKILCSLIIFIKIIHTIMKVISALISLVIITKTYLYNFDPLKPHFYIVKLGFTGVYIIFLISAQKHRFRVLVRTASSNLKILWFWRWNYLYIWIDVFS